MKLASSLAQASRDEFVYVGRKGDVRAPWRYRLHQGLAIGVAGLAGIGGTALCFASGLPLLSLAYVGALGYVVWVWKYSLRLKHGAALLAADQLDEAAGVLSSVANSRFAPASVRALAWQNLAVVAARRGAHTEALSHAVSSAMLLGRARRPFQGPWRWINGFTRALLLAQLGRLDEARALRCELERAPNGEYFQILAMNTDLMIAFVGGTPERLPADLHEWNRTALQTTTAELALALLAWAHFERGDADMGAHLREQALDRIDRRSFARSYPAVEAWLRIPRA